MRKSGCSAPCEFIVLIVVLGLVWRTYAKEQRSIQKNIANAQMGIAKNDSLRNVYMASGAEFRARQNAQDELDSLGCVNWHLFNVAAEKYYDRIDRQYTMGIFLDAHSISELNKTIMPYLNARAGDSDIDYKYAKQNLPITEKTQLTVFIELVNILQVKPQDMAPLDMIFHNGQLMGFNDACAEETFESFLEDSYAGYMTEEGPNFELQEMKPIRPAYEKNARQMDSLRRVVQHNDSIINKRMKEFDAQRDSLNAVLRTNQKSL